LPAGSTGVIGRRHRGIKPARARGALAHRRSGWLGIRQRDAHGDPTMATSRSRGSAWPR
jgi:hypothetical protein